MHVHLRINRWVIWWICVGVVLGAIAVTNILAHHLTGTQDRILIILGVSHWLLGGMVCWAFEGVKVETRQPSNPPPVPNPSERAQSAQATEFHPPSDFLLPGSTRSLLPWRH